MMLRPRVRFLFLALILSACGETSDRKNTQDKDKNPEEQGLETGAPSSLSRQPEHVPPTSEDFSISSTKIECQRSDVAKVKVAIHPNAPEKGAFNFAYQYVPASGNKPTIIVLPGGPGGDAISDLENRDGPKDFGLVNIDPRGVGCSLYTGSDNILEGGLTTENYAQDVIAVIKTLNLTNYLIYGVSYGSLITTVTANAIEKQKMIPPKVVLLEGVIGRFYEQNNMQDEYIRQWQIFASRFPSARSLFSEYQVPMNFSRDEWTLILRGLLQYFPRVMESTLQNLATSSGFKRQQLEGKYRPFFAQFLADQIDAPGSKDFYEIIRCREMSGHDGKYIFLEGSDLVRKQVNDSKKNLCSGINLDHPYDSKNYQINAPVYYFQGDQDPATPLVGAKYHFDNQLYRTNKTFTVIRNAAHNPMNIEVRDCRDQIFYAVASLKDLSDVLDLSGSCLNPTTGANLAGSRSNSESPFQINSLRLHFGK